MTPHIQPVELPSELQTRQAGPAEIHEHVRAEDLPKPCPAPRRTAQVGHFLLHFLEMQIPMVLGALLCYLLGRLIPASSSFATAYHPGTYLYATGDVLYLTVPVVAWMIFRGHGWRHSLEMALAMLAPVAVIVVLGQLAGYAYLVWLVTAMYPAMCLGLLVCMLYRRDLYTGKAGHSAHAAAREVKPHAMEVDY